MRALYLAYFVHESTIGRTELDDFREAEAFLHRCLARSGEDKRCEINAADTDVLQRVPAIHDRQLDTSPARIFVAADRRMDRFLTSNDALSPIAGSSLTELRDVTD